MTAPKLILATHNQGKLRELRELLRGQVLVSRAEKKEAAQKSG